MHVYMYIHIYALYMYIHIYAHMYSRDHVQLRQRVGDLEEIVIQVQCVLGHFQSKCAQVIPACHDNNTQ